MNGTSVMIKWEGRIMVANLPLKRETFQGCRVFLLDPWGYKSKKILGKKYIFTRQRGS